MSRFQPFLEFLENWEAPAEPLDEVLRGCKPEEFALLGVDLVKGFCSQGPLASPRVGALLPVVTKLCDRLLEWGATKFYWPCDRHRPDSLEFNCFPPHCVEGTEEAELADPLKGHKVMEHSQIIPKRTIDSLVDTELEKLLTGDQKLTTLLCVGDCTDLCLYQLALGLRYLANAHQLNWRVLVLREGIDTYDLPVEVAEEIGALPHPGDFFHEVFLYHMVLQGVEVTTL